MSTEDSLAQLLLQHPGLIARKVERGGVVMNGVVRVQSRFHRLKLHLPDFPLISNCKLYVLQEQRLKAYNATDLGLADHYTVAQLLEQLNTLHPLNHETKPLTLNMDSNIYAEILKLTDFDDYKIKVNSQYTRIHISDFAGHGLEHYLVLELPSLRILEHTLPDCVPWHDLFKKSAHTLSEVVILFQKYLDELSPFYDSFVNIDELCHVVQPSLPTTKSNWRLFLLSERVYLKLTIADPFATVSSMSVQIIGPTLDVERLRTVFSDGMRSWDDELDIHKNLLRIFDLCYFPMPPDDNEEQQYCNICYCYRLDQGEVPIVSCDNPHCQLIFHAACLSEWFNTLSNGKTFADVAFGACPFCKAKLSTSFDTLLAN